MKKTVIWLDNYLEEFFMVISLILMTVIMGIQVFSRYVLGSAPSWSEEITRYLFVWSGFLSVSYCTKKCISIKIEQFVSIFPRRGKALFKPVSYTHLRWFRMEHRQMREQSVFLTGCAASGLIHA